MDEGRFSSEKDAERPVGVPDPAAPSAGVPPSPRAPVSAAKAAFARGSAPSFLKVFRTVLFLVVAAGALVLAGRRWTSAFARFRVFSETDVSSLLAAEAAPPAERSSQGEETKKPRQVVFRLEAPGAKAVLLGGTFNGFNARNTPLGRGKDDVWETVLTLEPGRYLYKFKVDGVWTLDPSNPDSTSPPRQASVLEIQ